MTISLKVNESGHSVDVDPGTPLLYVLRDDLQLNGAKYGCGLGQCGACTVHVDGEAVFSCLTPVGAIGTRKVTTIEASVPLKSPAWCSRPLLMSRRLSVAIASRAWSCGRRLCWMTFQPQRMRKSVHICSQTSVAVAPTPASCGLCAAQALS